MKHAYPGPVTRYRCPVCHRVRSLRRLPSVHPELWCPVCQATHTFEPILTTIVAPVWPPPARKEIPPC